MIGATHVPISTPLNCHPKSLWLLHFRWTFARNQLENHDCPQMIGIRPVLPCAPSQPLCCSLVQFEPGKRSFASPSSTCRAYMFALLDLMRPNCKIQPANCIMISIFRHNTILLDFDNAGMNEQASSSRRIINTGELGISYQPLTITLTLTRF